MTNRTAFVTCASRGIGKASAPALADAGAREEAGYIAGHVLDVNGGLYMGSRLPT